MISVNDSSSSSLHFDPIKPQGKVDPCQKILQAIQSECHCFLDFAHHVSDQLPPCVHEKILVFQTQHRQRLDLLKTPELRWSDLVHIPCHEHPDPDHTIRDRDGSPIHSDKMCHEDQWDLFRTVTNNFVIELVNDTCQTLQLPPISHRLLGSTGWKSDNDIELTCPSPISNTQYRMLTTLAELIATEIIQGSPTLKLETEFYTLHSANRFEMYQRIDTTPHQHQYESIQLSLAFLQNIRSYGGKSSAGWNEFKKNLKNHIGPEEEKIEHALNQAMEQAETFDHQIDIDTRKAYLKQQNATENPAPLDVDTLSDLQILEQTSKLHRHDPAYLLAQKQMKMSRIQHLEQNIDTHLTHIKKLREQAQNESQQTLKYQSIQHKIGQLQIEITKAASIIVSFADEGVYTDAEILKTVYGKGSQSTKIEAEKNLTIWKCTQQLMQTHPIPKRSTQKSLEKLQRVLRKVSSIESFKSFSKSFDSLSKELTPSQSSSESSQHIKERGFQALKNEDPGIELTSSQFPIATLETLGQLAHVESDMTWEQSKEKLLNSVISSSKYRLRCAQGALGCLKTDPLIPRHHIVQLYDKIPTSCHTQEDLHAWEQESIQAIYHNKIGSHALKHLLLEQGVQHSTILELINSSSLWPSIRLDSSIDQRKNAYYELLNIANDLKLFDEKNFTKKMSLRHLLATFCGFHPIRDEVILLERMCFELEKTKRGKQLSPEAFKLYLHTLIRVNDHKKLELLIKQFQPGGLLFDESSAKHHSPEYKFYEIKDFFLREGFIPQDRATQQELDLHIELFTKYNSSNLASPDPHPLASQAPKLSATERQKVIDARNMPYLASVGLCTKKEIMDFKKWSHQVLIQAFYTQEKNILKINACPSHKEIDLTEVWQRSLHTKKENTL